MEPFPHDEIPDTRHDHPATNGIRGFWEGEEEAASSNDTHPPTRLMSADERAAALVPGLEEDDEHTPAEPILPPPPVYSADAAAGRALPNVEAKQREEGERETTGLTDVTRRLERKTLPSARMTPPPPTNESPYEHSSCPWSGGPESPPDNPRFVPWSGGSESPPDNPRFVPWSGGSESPTSTPTTPVPASDVSARAFDRILSSLPPPGQTVFDDGYEGEHEADEAESSPGLWGRVQRFVGKIGKKTTSAPPPSPQVLRPQQALGALFDLVWLLDEGQIDSLSAHLERVSALRRLGSDAYAEARILDALAGAGFTVPGNSPSSPAAVSLKELRARVPEIAKEGMDRALLRLESRGCVSLLRNTFGGTNDRDTLKDPVRGAFHRIALRVQVR